MSLNQYFYDLAKVSALIAGAPIKPEWIYCQWQHESTNIDENSEYYGQPFKSDLARLYNNLGGVTQEEPNDTPQPDGNYYYIQFGSYEDYAEYFGKYLRYFRVDGIYESETLEDYITALKRGKYFGDTLENYLARTKEIYNAEFA